MTFKFDAHLLHHQLIRFIINNNNSNIIKYGWLLLNLFGFVQLVFHLFDLLLTPLCL